MSDAIAPVETAEIPELPERPSDSHKGTFGRVLIAAGSQFMPGAAVLAATAAYRAGAGLVTVLTDTDVVPLVASGISEAVFTDWSAVGEKLALGEPLGYDAVLVGPGLGLEGRGRLVLDLIRNAGAPVIIDADALNLIAVTPDFEPASRDHVIWTPHPGEFGRLTGASPRGNTERLADARRFVGARGGVLVLKGHRTVVMDRARYAINRTGNPGMATAGSGDVLAGAMVAFLGQGLAPFEAARLAVHVHGLAGDLAAEELGEVSVMAGDMVELLPEAFAELGES